MVMKGTTLHGAVRRAVREAWKAATDLSEPLQHHLPCRQALQDRCCRCPRRCTTTSGRPASACTRLEPAVADGGKLIIYAPHIDEVSYTHGKVLDEIGYHVRDYFVKQWDRFKRFPGASWPTAPTSRASAATRTGVETPRVNVVLATRIPEERCRQINLGYMDSAPINPADYAGREDEGVLLVPKAGEMLYRAADLS